MPYEDEQSVHVYLPCRDRQFCARITFVCDMNVIRRGSVWHIQHQCCDVIRCITTVYALGPRLHSTDKNLQ